jgi:N6-adenosine-specific RNA methylase IME4
MTVTRISSIHNDISHRRDGGPDGRGVGFYFRNVTELLPFGVRGNMREHSRKPDEIYEIIESCSPGPYLELFARFRRKDWAQWGNEDVEQNTRHNVAQRKGHIEPQLRLLESPRGYRGTTSR